MRHQSSVDNPAGGGFSTRRAASLLGLAGFRGYAHTNVRRRIRGPVEDEVVARNGASPERGNAGG